MDGLKNTQVNTGLLIGIVVLAVAAAGYFFWLRPAQQAKSAQAEWTSESAAAKRGPNAPKNPVYEAKVQELLAKERAGRPARTSTPRERE